MKLFPVRILDKEEREKEIKQLVEILNENSGKLSAVVTRRSDNFYCVKLLAFEDGKIQNISRLFSGLLGIRMFDEMDNYGLCISRKLMYKPLEFLKIALEQLLNKEEVEIELKQDLVQIYELD